MNQFNIFPYELVEKGETIILYGYGEVGRDYFAQLQNSSYCSLSAVVDQNWGYIKDCKIGVKDPQCLKEMVFDRVVIANKSSETAYAIQRFLLSLGIPKEKIVHRHQECTLPAKNPSGSVACCENWKRPAPDFLWTDLCRGAAFGHVALWGDKRRVNDFCYLFPQIKAFEVSGRTEAFTVLCSAQNKKIARELEQDGKRYGLNYVFATDFAKLLDFPEHWPASGRHICIWPMDNGAALLNQFINCYGKQIADFVVADMADGALRCCGLAAAADSVMLPISDCHIIFLGAPDSSLENQLKNQGILCNRDYIVWNDSPFLASRLYGQMFYSSPRDLPFCKFMFSECLEVYADGEGFSCCRNWLDIPVGNIGRGSLDDVWNSNTSKLLRLSAVNRTYAFCNLRDCTRMLQYYKPGKFLPQDVIVSEEDYGYPAREFPKELSAAIDYTCNLHCASCRSGPLAASGKALEDIWKLADKLEEKVLPYVEAVKLAGNGEVFFSRVYKRLLYKGAQKPNIRRLTLLTNGQLFTRESFEKLEPFYQELLMDVSIDAATKETYEKLRCGGSWEVLKANMAYAGQLRRQGRLKHLQLNYVYSRENYQEMPAFVRWAKQLGADAVQFSRILHMPHAMPQDEFLRITLYETDGKLKEPFQKFFEDPIFRDPIVVPGTLE